MLFFYLHMQNLTDMKKIYLGILCLVMVGNILAQPTITKSDMPVVGDTIWFKTTSLAPGINYQQTGNNFNWDFSTLTGTAAADTFISITSTSFTLQLTFGLGANPANIAQNSADLSFIPGIPLSNFTNFFRSSNTAYQLNGFGLGIYGIGLPIKFSGADVWYKFPLTINSLSDSSVSNYSQSLLTLGYLKINRKRVNKVDGWGTLITPYGSFQTLRVKSVVHEEDSIYLDTLSAGVPIVRDYTEYKWWVNGHHAPVMQVTAESLLSTFRWIDSPVNVGISQYSQEQTISISPNPASGQVRLSINSIKSSSVSVQICNITGQVIGELYKGNCTQGNNTVHLNIDKNKYPPGMYFLNIDFDSHRLTRKLIID